MSCKKGDSWKWHVCVAVPLGFAVSEWCFRGVESRCYIGICSCKVAWKAPFLWQVSGKTSILLRVEVVKIIWGKCRKSFFVAGAAHCRLEGWKSWFCCIGAGFRESDTFVSQFHWDLQFQGGVLEVLNCAVTLGFAMQIVCSEVRFCQKSRVKRSFWKLGLSLLVKISWKMLVWEAWIGTFGESLVENARFGGLDCHFWWKSQAKRSLWELG